MKTKREMKNINVANTLLFILFAGVLVAGSVGIYSIISNDDSDRNGNLYGTDNGGFLLIDDGNVGIEDISDIVDGDIDEDIDDMTIIGPEGENEGLPSESEQTDGEGIPPATDVNDEDVPDDDVVIIPTEETEVPDVEDKSNETKEVTAPGSTTGTSTIAITPTEDKSKGPNVVSFTAPVSTTGTSTIAITSEEPPPQEVIVLEMNGDPEPPPQEVTVLEMNGDPPEDDGGSIEGIDGNPVKVVEVKKDIIQPIIVDKNPKKKDNSLSIENKGSGDGTDDDGEERRWERTED